MSQIALIDSPSLSSVAVGTETELERAGALVPKDANEGDKTAAGTTSTEGDGEPAANGDTKKIGGLAYREPCDPYFFPG